MAPSFDDANLFNFVVRDGNGVKGMVDAGLSKVPRAYLQPPQERIDKDAARKHGQPPIDLSKLDGPKHDQVAEQIVRAAESLGFFQVVNHGVPVELLESLKDTAHDFFSMSPEKKAVYRTEVSPTPLVKYGTSFMPQKEKALEWKDYISMQYTNDDEALQHWPAEIKKVSLEYLRTSMSMVRKLLQVLLENLGVKPDDSITDVLLDKKMVNMNFYPTCPSPDLTVGVGRHSDMGTLTILLQDGIGGLYVKIEEDSEFEKKGEWVEIPPVPGALVINVGDMIQIISNGKYKSAEHRVRTTSTKSRVSIPIFTMPNATAKIAPLPQVVEKDGQALYREFVLADYMKNFFGNAHDGKKSLDFATINAA
ncbi:2-oxoglutarate and Fe(II)-dependent oxygenase superfamily protein [Hibiscus syriacus]|uniref:2-oxoglutarate and Fe(II)-dependent oxygenase superfamily protein n=1 Tax=Hibiscus syriacus TaxID=106335 RepID=A0A6A2YWM8_HIBSY|nr:scopoletin 8-hydroxylase-like [Hibiscus syriacus]KAE8683720.1 2-oxoglutarate and Fe(II)-dependent oxygenase superfamily protein [Hibiscus syriacus]